MSSLLSIVQCWMLEVCLCSFYKVWNQEFSIARILYSYSLFFSNILEKIVLSLWIWYIYLLSY